MEDQIQINPIGIIHTPYKNLEDIPIQGIFNKEVLGWIELKLKYKNGLLDLNQFSHAILIYYFHKSKNATIKAIPYLENKSHGIFSIRSPHRPNHLGITTVKIQKIVENKLYFTEVDMLDGTPLIDIKPYVQYFDQRDKVNSGWIEKHFNN